LKKALLVKTEKDYLKNQIGITRDSVAILSVIVSQQDTLIKNKNNQIDLYKKNELNYTQIIDNKSKQIGLYDKELKKVRLADKSKSSAFFLGNFVRSSSYNKRLFS
jgi:hypothetical protein